jgi:3-oxoadipate enol-lactonase
VLDYDHRGYGFSDRPKQRYTVDTWADDLVAMLDELNIQKTAVHGGSMGAFIAVKFATKYPDRVDRLVLTGGVAKSDYAAVCYYKTWQSMVRAYGLAADEVHRTFLMTAYSRRYLDEHGGDDLIAESKAMTLRNASDYVFLEACQAMIDMDVRDQLGRIASPTLLLVGDEDRITPLDTGPDGAGMRYMADHIPGARLEVFPQCSHGLLFEYPDRASRTIIEFLSEP